MKLIPEGTTLHKVLTSLQAPKVWCEGNLERVQFVHKVAKQAGTFPREGLEYLGIASLEHYQLGLSNVITLVAAGHDTRRLPTNLADSVGAKATQLAWEYVDNGYIWESATICTPKGLVDLIEKAHIGQPFSREAWESSAKAVNLSE